MREWESEDFKEYPYLLYLTSAKRRTWQEAKKFLLQRQKSQSQSARASLYVQLIPTKMTLKVPSLASCWRRISVFCSEVTSWEDLRKVRPCSSPQWHNDLIQFHTTHSDTVTWGDTVHHISYIINNGSFTFSSTNAPLQPFFCVLWAIKFHKFYILRSWYAAPEVIPSRLQATDLPLLWWLEVYSSSFLAEAHEVAAYSSSQKEYEFILLWSSDGRHSEKCDEYHINITIWSISPLWCLLHLMYLCTSHGWRHHVTRLSFVTFLWCLRDTLTGWNKSSA